MGRIFWWQQSTGKKVHEFRSKLTRVVVRQNVKTCLRHLIVKNIASGAISEAGYEQIQTTPTPNHAGTIYFKSNFPTFFPRFKFSFLSKDHSLPPTIPKPRWYALNELLNHTMSNLNFGIIDTNLAELEELLIGKKSTEGETEAPTNRQTDLFILTT